MGNYNTVIQPIKHTIAITIHNIVKNIHTLFTNTYKSS